MPKVELAFPGSGCSSIWLEEGSSLSEHLTVENSPLLFGCRTGICGTCLVKVENLSEAHLPPPNRDEREVLDLIAAGEPEARLACQIKLRWRLELSTMDEGL